MRKTKNRSLLSAVSCSAVLTVFGLLLGGTAPSVEAKTNAGARHHAHHHHHHHRAQGRGSGMSCAGSSPHVCFSGDPFSGYAGQCTWYAAGRRPDLDGIVWGNAGAWLNEARGKLPEGTAPRAGAIAVWLPRTGGAGAYGHVAYVAAVNGGAVTVEDFNWESEQWHRHTVSASLISGYIYTRTGSAPPPAPSAPTPEPPVTVPVAPPEATHPTDPPGTSAPPAYVHHVTGTCRDGHCGLTVRSGPGYTTYAALGALPESAVVEVVCQTLGEAVSNGYYSSTVWDRLTGGGWVSDFYLDTPNIGTWSPPIPQC